MVVGAVGFAPTKASGRQIYSLVRLTAPPRALTFHDYMIVRDYPDVFKFWSRPRELNSEPSLYKSVALPLS